jgi:integrase
MGFGSAAVRSLAEARHKALECRRLLLEGMDPIEARREHRRARALETARLITFDQCAEAYIASHEASWKNEKHRHQWRQSLGSYASPVIGRLPVQSIDTSLVLRVLEPIWATKAETASRLRNRIELVLDWATAREHRTGENPARWRGHLDKLLPARSRVQKIQHHRALPLEEISTLMERLRAQEDMAPLALEFVILTACRTGEVLGARWSEIDLVSKMWTIPAVRMKAGREHRVPLSPRAVEILETVQKNKNIHTDNDLVFHGRRPTKSLSSMSLLMVLRRMKIDAVVHGFRSTFRDWAADRTVFPREVAETALAHVLRDKTEAAYRRGDFFEKRRKLMNAWADFCSPTTAIVSPASVIGISTAREA